MQLGTFKFWKVEQKIQELKWSSFIWKLCKIAVAPICTSDSLPLHRNSRETKPNDGQTAENTCFPKILKLRQVCFCDEHCWYEKKKNKWRKEPTASSISLLFHSKCHVFLTMPAENILCYSTACCHMNVHNKPTTQWISVLVCSCDFTICVSVSVRI